MIRWADVPEELRVTEEYYRESEGGEGWGYCSPVWVERKIRHLRGWKGQCQAAVRFNSNREGYYPCSKPGYRGGNYCHVHTPRRKAGRWRFWRRMRWV